MIMSSISVCRKIFWMILPIFIFECCTYEQKSTIVYPKLKYVNDTLIRYNDTIIDNLTYLEKDTNLNINEWIEAQNHLTDSVVNSIEDLSKIKAEMEKAVFSSNERGGFPKVNNNKVYFVRTLLKEKEQKLMCREGLNGSEIELFNTKNWNNMKEEYNIDYYEPSPDNKYIILGYSINGDEMTYIRIIDISTRKLLPETIERCPYGYPVWHPKKAGFFYAQLQEIKSLEDRSKVYEDSEVKFHLLGDDIKKDKVIFSRKNNRELNLENIDLPSFAIYPNSDKVFCIVPRGSSRFKAVYFASIKEIDASKDLSKVKWHQVASNEKQLHVITYYNETLYALEFSENPNGRIVKYDLKKPKFVSTVIYDAKNELLQNFILTNKNLFCKVSRNGNSMLLAFNLANDSFEIVKLPFVCNIGFISPYGNNSLYSNTDGLYMAIDSWSNEVAVYYYDHESKFFTKTTLRKQGKYNEGLEIEVKEVEVTSHDGEKVPLSLVYKKGIKLDGTNPTIINAYGAYGTSLNSSFYLPHMVWFKMGGVLAIAHVRGGGEKGYLWHKAGFKDTKPNSWKDFIACSEYLILNKYTSPSKLSAKGESAGAITVGRAITEKPELYKAALLEVGLLNALRFDKLSNSFVMSEFGDGKTEESYKDLKKMDVIYNTNKLANYPSLLITSGLNDTRVDWWMPAKAAAKFQQLSKDNIILLKVDGGGHGGSSDIVKQESEYMAFLLWQLNHKTK